MSIKKYDDYVVFLLGMEDFDISKHIREIANEWSSDSVYDDCIYIAKKFEIYDKDKYDTISQYDSLRHFLDEYNKEIMDYLDMRIGFELKGVL